MASCFSKPGVISIPPVYVISRITGLPACLQESALPGLDLTPIDFPASFEEDGVLPDELIKDIKDCEIVICDPALFKKIYMYMPKIKWVHSTWAGVENLLEAMHEKKPSFVLTRHAGKRFCGAMADYVMCHILNCERSTKLFYKSQESRTWLKATETITYRTLDEITVGVLGVGNMGSEIACFLKARGTNVIGFCRRNRSVCERGPFNYVYTDLDEILASSDYICNTLPCTPLTRGLLNNSTLQKCTKKPVFINVGRSTIISEDDLILALRNGFLSGAVLDVFETEPLPKSSRLWDMPKVTITPHVAALSRVQDIAEEFYRNFANYIDGHGLENVIDWSDGY